MKRDDIIRMAKEAGFNQILATTTGANVWIDDGFYVEELERFADLVAAAEREACARVCDEVERKATRQPPMCGQACQACAAAIRSRGEVKP